MENMNVQMFQCSNVPITHSNVPMFQFFSVPRFQCSIGPLDHWSVGPLVHWTIGPLVHWLNVKCQMSNVKCQMLSVNKVKLLSEHTSGVPLVILKFPPIKVQQN